MWHGGAGGVMIGCQMPEQPKEPPFPCPRNWIAKLNQAAKLDCQEHKRNTRGVSVGGRGGDRRASVSPTSSSRVVTHHHHHHNQPAAEADQRLWAAESWANWPSAVATGGGGPAPGWAAEVLVVGGREDVLVGGGRRRSSSWAARVRFVGGLVGGASPPLVWSVQHRRTRDLEEDELHRNRAAVRRLPLATRERRDGGRRWIQGVVRNSFKTTSFFLQNNHYTARPSRIIERRE